MSQTKALKVNTPIPKAGATSVDPLAQTKSAIEAILMNTNEVAKAEVDDHLSGR